MRTEEHKPGLKLTRRCGEAILVGDNIEIQVEFTGRRFCHLRIIAPREINIVRKELLDNDDLCD